jgi:hypothetical protein
VLLSVVGAFILFRMPDTEILCIAAGQRCMAISVALLVGEAHSWLPELIERATKLKVNGGFEPGADLSVHSPSLLLPTPS